MVRALFIILVTFSASVFADGVKYADIEPIKAANMNFRDTWDKSHQFCYNDADKNPHCLDIVGMGEVKLREKGEWSSRAEDQAFISKLTDTQKEDGLNYDKIFVRYLALDANASKFVVHVHFLDKGAEQKMSQTIFVMGDNVAGKKAEAREMSYSNGMEYFGGALKAALTLGSSVTNKSEAESKQLLEDQMVKFNQGLINIGESVVNSYLGSMPGASVPANRP